LLLAVGPAGHLLLITVVAGWWLVGAVGCEDDDQSQGEIFDADGRR
jgi:hypothetical protein